VTERTLYEGFFVKGDTSLILFISSFLVRLTPVSSSRPSTTQAPARAGAVKAGRRFGGHRWPGLDGFEHDGTLQRVGMTLSRGARVWHTIVIVPQPCIRRVQRTQTMMQPCASAAKLRGGGPILRNGIESHCTYGTPPPRTVIRPSSSVRTGLKPSGVAFSHPPPFSSPDAEQRPRAPRPRA
jgi:hypothetical protein